MTKSLADYRNDTLCDEIARRSRAGSDLLSLYNTLPGTIRVYPHHPDMNYRVRKGSKRWNTLRYEISDRQLMTEVMQRIARGNHDCWMQYKMMLRSGDLGPNLKVTWRR